MSLTDSSPLEVARAASLSSRSLAILPLRERNDALTAIHHALLQSKDSILAANARDVESASQAAADGTLSQSVLNRLDLSRKGKWDDMLQGILDVRDLDDPIGKVNLRTKLDEGLILERVTCPIGVLLIIFEARPEVIANITSLAIKSGNAAILKGGKESTSTFIAISQQISAALAPTSVPNASIQLLTTRDPIPILLTLDQYIDLVIPRGSNALVRNIKSTTRIPVLGHADGLCAIYLASDCPPSLPTKILLDAKTGYPAACNAVETLLVDEAVLRTLLPPAASALLSKGVSLRCDEQAIGALKTALASHEAALLIPAAEADYSTEFLDLTLAIKTIPTQATPGTALALAIAHINTHSSHHTDAILTSDASLAKAFQRGVDSACVFWNTSTRMADGMRFGFGTEVGISTSKIHARGPVGLEGLCGYKYLVSGHGEVAGEYGAGGKNFLHERMMVGED